MKAKQIIGIVLLIALIVSLGYKLSASLPTRNDNGLIIYFFVLIALIVFLALRRILRN